MRTDLRRSRKSIEEEKNFGERRREHLGVERVSFRKNEEKWVFGYKDSGNWNSKLGIIGLSFSGGVKSLFHTVVLKNHFPKLKYMSFSYWMDGLLDLFIW